MGSSVHDFLTNLDMDLRHAITVVIARREPPCIHAGIYHALLPTGDFLYNEHGSLLDDRWYVCARGKSGQRRTKTAANGGRG